MCLTYFQKDLFKNKSPINHLQTAKKWTIINTANESTALPAMTINDLHRSLAIVLRPSRCWVVQDGKPQRVDSCYAKPKCLKPSTPRYKKRFPHSKSRQGNNPKVGS